MRRLDKIVRNPSLTLSFDKEGKEVWSTKPTLVSKPITEQRAVWENVLNGKTTDDIIIQILKRNPGVEVQLYNNNGIFPYMAIRANGRKREEMFLPKGVDIYADAIWVDWSRKTADICLAEFIK